MVVFWLVVGVPLFVFGLAWIGFRWLERFFPKLFDHEEPFHDMEQDYAKGMWSAFRRCLRSLRRMSRRLRWKSLGGQSNRQGRP